MAGISTYMEARLLNAALRNTPFTPAANLYVALFTTAPTDQGGGTEVSTGSYVRQALAFSAPAAGTVGLECANTSEVVFPEATGAWGTVTHFAVFDAPSTGNMLFWGTLSNTKDVTVGTVARFKVGDLKIGMD